MMFDKARQLADMPASRHTAWSDGGANWSYGWHLHADGVLSSVKGVVKNIDSACSSHLVKRSMLLICSSTTLMRVATFGGTWHRKLDEERGTLPATAPASEYCR